MNQVHQKRLFALLVAARRKEERFYKRQGKPSRGSKYVIYFEILTALAAVVCMFSAQYVNSHQKLLTWLSIFLISITIFVGFVVLPLVLGWNHRDALAKVAKNPLGAGLENLLIEARIRAQVDAWLLSRLLETPTAHLELFLLEIQMERRVFEGRLNFLAGSIEKIGVLPGLLAVVLTVVNLADTKPGWNPYLPSFAVTYLAFYFILKIMHRGTPQLERFADLTQLAVSQRRAGKAGDNAGQ